jgi:hypothetical protein
MNSKIEFLHKNDTSFQNVMICQNFVIKRFKNQGFVYSKIMNCTKRFNSKKKSLKKFLIEVLSMKKIAFISLGLKDYEFRIKTMIFSRNRYKLFIFQLLQTFLNNRNIGNQ